MFFSCVVCESDEEDENRQRIKQMKRRRRRRIHNSQRSGLSLEISMLENPLYPEYSGREGPYAYTDNNPLDYLQLLWPESLVDEFLLETNKYAHSRPSLKNWSDVDRDEIWTFLGVNLLMAIHH